MTTFNSDPEGIRRSARRKGSRRLRLIQIVSLIMAFSAALFVWWATNLSIEASDTGTAAPFITDWIGVGIVVVMLSMMTSFGAGLAIFMRSKKR